MSCEKKSDFVLVCELIAGFVLEPILALILCASTYHFLVEGFNMKGSAAFNGSLAVVAFATLTKPKR